MTSNVTLNLATVGGGSTIATEDIGGIQFQRVKLALGASGQDLGDVSGSNPMVVEMGGASVSAFGDLIVAENNPLIQMDFVYGINAQTGASTIVTTGVVDTSAARLRVQSGTGAAGSGLFESKRAARYRPGQGMTARFTAAFATSAANSSQTIGVGTAANGYFVGYNGVDFGILHRNNSTDTWVAQTAWNGDKCNGTGTSGFTINTAFGNVFQIRYPYLGYGAITFWILNSTGRWILCHTIQYPNTTATTQLSNPSLHFRAQAINTGSTTNLTIYCGSVGVSLSGIRSFTSYPKWAYDNNKASITAETNIFSLKNCTTYNGSTNEGQLRLNSISVGASGSSGVVVLRLRIGATLGGTATYAAISGTTADNGVTITSGSSIASVNTIHTTATGGTYIYNLSLNGAGAQVIDLTALDIFIAPTEILTLSGFATNAATISASLNWVEDQ